MNILELLEYEEGYREKPYYCSEKYPTVGIGTKIGPKGADLSLYQFTVNKHAAYSLLNQEVDKIKLKLSNLEWYCDLDNDRKIIIESMCYQIGVSGVLKFKKMIAALSGGYGGIASNEALDSRWAKQTPARAERHAKVLSGMCLSSVYNQ